MLVSLYGRSSSDQDAWRILAILLVGLGVDEAVQFHEAFVPALRNAFGFSGPLSFAWVVPYSVLVMVLGPFVLPAVFRLPPRSRARVVVAAGVFVTGAIGMEIVGAAFAASQSQDTFGYAMTTTVEETLEIVGAATAIDAFLRLVAGQTLEIRVE